MSLKTLLVVAVLCLSLTVVAVADEVVEDVVEEVEETEEVNDGFSDEERAFIAENTESHQFQAEVNRLMDIIINSLYSNREIFVRELISNAADALDKVRFQSLKDKSVLADKEELEIRIEYDEAAKTLTFTDSGVGMTREQLISNLGVVAKSGTTEFVEAATSGSDALSLIGQFGVGFYSVYLAADKVTVTSKNVDDPHQHIWESTADSVFTVVQDPRGNTLGRGTSVTLHLKEDAEEFLSVSKLEEIVTRYSSFIQFPIFIREEKTVSTEVPLNEEELAALEEVESEDDESEGDDEDLEVSDEEDEDAAPKTKTVQETVIDWKRVNKVKAIWTRSPSDITEEEYNDFYKSLTKADEDPLTKIHFTAEGEITFRSILYIPKKAEPGLYDKFYEKSTSLKLYVRKVLISDEFDDFLPRYLNFVKGVVDSEDLPLNVSRETLAQSRVLKVMSKKITRKVLEMLRKLSQRDEDEDEDDEDEEDEDEDEDAEANADEDEIEDEAEADDYLTFWEQFGKSIKLGIIDDRSNKSKLTKLLRYVTSKSNGKFISLEDYVDRMSDDQRYIYYITGSSIDSVESSPFLEKLVKRGYEVIYMVDPLDEYVTQSLTEFDGNTLMSATKEGLKFGDEDTAKEEALAEEFSDFTEWLAGVYGSKVEKVVVSNRIATSPCVLVTGQYGWSANMERIMKAQTFGNADQQQYMLSKKTLEINPRHPIIRSLKERSEADAEDEAVADLATLMYDAALLSSGFQMEDSNDFATRIHRVIGAGLGVDPNEEIPEEEEPVTSEEDENDEEIVELEDEVETEAEEMDEAVPSDEGHDEL